MYIVFWRKGNRKPDLAMKPLAFCPGCGRNVNAVQSWKNPQRRYGRYRQSYVYRCDACNSVVEPYYYAGYNAIDWSIPAPRIGDRARTLKERTLRRVEIGLDRFDGQHLIIPLAYTHGHDERARPLSDAIPTQTARQDMALALSPMPFLVAPGGPQGVMEKVTPMNDAIPTQLAVGHHALVSPMPFFSMQYTPGYNIPVTDPAATVTCWDHHAVVSPPPYIIELHGTSDVRAVTEALSTVATSGAHHGLVMPKPFLMSYYGNAGHSGVDEAVPTVTTLDRHALVRPQGDLRVEDCGFRMLQPHEIQAAMAFPKDYVVLGTNRDK
jgi:DNA (cytosine-5)-methyltransferase 1